MARGSIKKGPPVGIRKRRGQSHQTHGKDKGLIPTPDQRIMAKQSRSYKLPGYEHWCKSMDEKNGMKR